MASTAQGDEVFIPIASQKASRLNMMNLKILGDSTPLTSPAIAFEHPPRKLSIGIRVQSKPGLSWDTGIHDAFGICSKNSRLRAFGSNV